MIGPPPVIRAAAALRLLGGGALIAGAFAGGLWLARHHTAPYAAGGASAAGVAFLLLVVASRTLERVLAFNAGCAVLMLTVIELAGWGWQRARAIPDPAWVAPSTNAHETVSPETAWELGYTTGYGAQVYFGPGPRPDDPELWAVFGPMVRRNTTWQQRTSVAGRVLDERVYRTGHFRERIAAGPQPAPTAYAGPVALFLGCSFTFGWQLGHADTIPQQVQRALGGELTAINLAYNGLSVASAARWLSPEEPSPVPVQPEQVRFGVLGTIGDHLARVAGAGQYAGRPTYDVRGDALVTAPPLAEGAPEGISSRLARALLPSYSLRPIAWWLLAAQPENETLERYLRLVRYTAERFEARFEAKLLVVHLSGFGAYDELLVKRLRASGVEVLAERDVFAEGYGGSLMQGSDPHPSALGAARVAAAVERWWRSRSPQPGQ